MSGTWRSSPTSIGSHPGAAHARQGLRRLRQFTVTKDITKYTRAKIFSQVGRNRMLSPFSTVAGECGAADAERRIRGFAMKFYTEEGNWDLVGNTRPYSSCAIPSSSPTSTHAVKRDPAGTCAAAKNKLDFWTSLPEALHQVTIVMSDRGIPAPTPHARIGSHTSVSSTRKMSGTGSVPPRHQQESEPEHEEAEAIVAKDREIHQRDLYESIEKGLPPWTLSVQIIRRRMRRNTASIPSILTKVWLKKDYPLIEVGVLELNRYPAKIS